jgi:hypothetical protein
MHTVRGWVERHPLLAFVGLACGFSWTLWGLMIASAQGWLAFRVPAGPWGGFGPLLAAWVLCAPAGIAATRRQFFRRTLLAWPGWRWTGIALPGPVLLIGLAVLVQAWAAPLPQLDPAPLLTLPLMFAIILVLGGPLGEEFGWRGYVLPLLLRGHAAWLASAGVAGLWLLWHLPLFWLEGAAQQGSSIAGFAAMVVFASLLFTWCYRHSGPGLWPVLLLHASINTGSYLLPELLPGVDASPVFGYGLLGAFGLAALLVVVLDPGMRRSPAA